VCVWSDGVNVVGLSVIFPHVKVVGLLTVILPEASLVIVVLPVPFILYWCLSVELSNNFKYVLPLVVLALLLLLLFVLWAPTYKCVV
jgi:hypothetical protein